MNVKKQSPAKILAIRQAADKRQFELLTKQTEYHLTHRSPSVYGTTDSLIKSIDTTLAHNDYAIRHVAAGMDATISNIIRYVR